MPKVIDDHAERALRSAISRRTTLSPTRYIEKRLNVCNATANKFLKHPMEIRLGDLKALGLTLEEIGGLL